MNCVRCHKEPAAITKVASCGEVGFCLGCWDKIDISGTCKCCGTAEDLLVHAKWFDRVIENICRTCRATEVCI